MINKEDVIYVVMKKDDDKDYNIVCTCISKEVAVQKCIEDIIINYTKERLNNRKLAIIKELENPSLPREDASMLEDELNNIIIELAKM